jgi:serine/threonine protein kinase
MDMGRKIWREIDIMKTFNHPHIIRLYEVIDTPTDLYVVLEYSPGGELFDYIVSKGRVRKSCLLCTQWFSCMRMKLGKCFSRSLLELSIVMDKEWHIEI